MQTKTPLIIRQLRALRDAYRAGKIDVATFSRHIQRCQAMELDRFMNAKFDKADLKIAA